MPESVQIRAPCRLHFGMFSFGHDDRPQFGGVGAMVDPPAVEVAIELATQFNACGALAARVEHFTRHVAKRWQLDSLPACAVKVESPPDHVGLGVGTQLGLAVAAGLRRFLKLPDVSIEKLAHGAGRGARSSVGTYGFRHGGLIVDAGKDASQSIGQLAARVELPAEWRIVLARPGEASGLAGDIETDAFTRLPPVPDEVTRQLWRITETEILPAIHRADCSAFGDAVYRFGKLAGECFAPVQGGPFADSEIARVVESIRDYGVPGVGQSSWGPTVFAFTASDAEARALADWLHDRVGMAEDSVTVARPNNCGAHISTL